MFDASCLSVWLESPDVHEYGEEFTHEFLHPFASFFSLVPLHLIPCFVSENIYLTDLSGLSQLIRVSSSDWGAMRCGSGCKVNNTSEVLHQPTPSLRLIHPPLTVTATVSLSAFEKRLYREDIPCQTKQPATLGRVSICSA